MAQAKKKKKKATGPDELALLYGIDPQTERYAALRAVLKEAGVRPKVVNNDQLGDPVGSLAHLAGFRPSPFPYEGQAPEAEILVFCNLSRKTLDEVLDRMREAAIDIPLKAMMTQTNMRWPFYELYRELTAEHNQMNGGA